MGFILKFCLLVQVVVLLNSAFVPELSASPYKDYVNHPCNRNCALSKSPKVCKYNFTIEMYSVLSRECVDCVNNRKDCFRPNCITADGFSRTIRVVNRMLPGPGIQVCQNDWIVVNVHNKLNSFESTSIHWHGLRQYKSMNYDGIAMITQCPIQPGTKFQYKFKALDRGTYFWHAHSSLQRADGVFGPLIIREKNDVNAKYYDKDDKDHVIVLNDWSHDLAVSNFNAFLHANGDEDSNSILVNGRGVKSDNTSEPSVNVPRAIFTVEKGHRIRFRVINAGVQFCPLEFSIENHPLLIIATDGQPIKPVEVASFVTSPGERVDFVLNANQTKDNYWIKIKGLADCEESAIYQKAVLRYQGAPIKYPKSAVNYDSAGANVEGKQLNPLNTMINDDNKDQYIVIDEVRSSENDKESANYSKIIASRVDRQFYLGIDMNYVENPEVYNHDTYKLDKTNPDHWNSPQINNITFAMPSIPLIYQPSKNPSNKFCNYTHRNETCPGGLSKFCKCIYTLYVDLNDVVEVVIADGGSQEENHPLHLHGYQFSVLGVEKLGNSTLLKDIKRMDKEGLLRRNLKNPPLKDSLVVPSGGYVIFRFHAINPGYWFFHCHVEFHHHSGMGLLFKVGEESDLPPKPDNWPTCGDFPK